jgi:hypothetical protein
VRHGCTSGAKMILAPRQRALEKPVACTACTGPRLLPVQRPVNLALL